MVSQSTTSDIKINHVQEVYQGLSSELHRVSQSSLLLKVVTVCIILSIIKRKRVAEAKFIEKVTKRRLHLRYLDEITTLPQLSGLSGRARG